MQSEQWTPARLDEWAKAEGANINTVRSLIPQECFVIEPKKAWWGLLVACVRWVISLVILYFIPLTNDLQLLWQIPALAAAWLFSGWAYTGLFVIGHDCAHMAFSEKKWVNEVVGHLCLVLEFTGFHNWRIWHNYHHAKTQLRRQDPDWAEQMMTLDEYKESPLGLKAHVRLGFGSPLGILVGFWVGMFRRTFMKQLAPQIPLAIGSSRQLLFSSLFMISTVAALSTTIVYFLGVWALLKFWFVPTFIAATHGAMLTYLHHTSADALVFDRAGWTPLRGQVISTFNVRFPTWVESMWFDINIHLPHHLAPKIPWYHLKSATEAIRQTEPRWVQERTFSLGYLLRSWARPLLRPDSSQDERFNLVSFGDAKRDNLLAPTPTPVSVSVSVSVSVFVFVFVFVFGIVSVSVFGARARARSLFPLISACYFPVISARYSPSLKLIRNFNQRRIIALRRFIRHLEPRNHNKLMSRLHLNPHHQRRQIVIA